MRNPRHRGAPGPYTPAQALRQECVLVGGVALALSTLALSYCYSHSLLLLYGDAVAHLHIARRITDSINPGFRQLGSVWLPLPHLLLLPFVQKMSLWQSGLAGAPPSMLAYVLGAAGLYRLARYWLPPRTSAVAAAFYALNPGLLYMQTTAMNEPLFLAEMIWSALLLTAYTRVVQRPATGAPRASASTSTPAAPHATSPATSPSPLVASPAAVSNAAAEVSPHNRAELSIQRLLLTFGLILAAAVFTRYDGWIYAALAWCLAAWTALRTGALRRRSGSAFLLFTAIVLASPLAWLAYNEKQFHDPFDFIRGPYSARAIELKTTPPGAPRPPGWHNMRIAGHYFLKTAELGAAPVHVTNLLLVVVLLGVAAACRRRQARAVLVLFWLPLPFYAYSVAYGSVPIFIPPWPPFAWYNTRYGLELLPAFALSLAMAVEAGARWLEQEGGVRLFGDRWLPVRASHQAAVFVGASLVLLVLNDVALLHARPLVFAEAVENSRTRLPFEGALARALVALPPQGRILMYTSDHIGAVQQAGIPLLRTINDTDYLAWNAALAHPAQAAPFVVTIEGDALARAVTAHPEGLTLLDLICSTGQPCARIYAATAAIEGTHEGDSK